MGILEKGPSSMGLWIEAFLGMGDAALSGLPDRRYHIRDRAGVLVRLVGVVYIRQRPTFTRPGVRCAIFDALHTPFFTRLTS